MRQLPVVSCKPLLNYFKELSSLRKKLGTCSLIKHNLQNFSFEFLSVLNAS